MDLTNNHLLVTGGAGFIGSHLVDALQPHRVRVLDDFSTGREHNLAHYRDSGKVEVVRGDIRDRDTVRLAMDGIDVVFHLACRGVRHSIGNPRQSHLVNAEGTMNVLQAAREAGVQRFVHVSSSEAYGTARRVPMDEHHPTLPETVYGAAKLAGEAYARAYHQTYGLPTVVVRPFNNFGPRSHFEGDCGEVIPRFCVLALNGKRPIVFGDGSQTRDFIYVEETAYWFRRIAECDALVGQTINLGSGRETSVLELARYVCEAADRPDLHPEFRPPRPGDVMRHCADATLARQTLDFQLRIDVKTGIAKTLEHIRRQAATPAELLAEIEEANWTVSR
jgi:UDP-glucose 4-epimerase